LTNVASAIAYFTIAPSHDGPFRTQTTIEMREFSQSDGRGWVASVAEEAGTDYKGRFYLVMSPTDAEESVELRDIRWNSERTARRTLETMSVVELRRRLRAATRRSSPGVGA